MAGWLVGTVLDDARLRLSLSVLDARRVDAGPLAIAWLPYALPLGLPWMVHGVSSELAFHR